MSNEDDEEPFESLLRPITAATLATRVRRTNRVNVVTPVTTQNRFATFEEEEEEEEDASTQNNTRNEAGTVRSDTPVQVNNTDTTISTNTTNTSPPTGTNNTGPTTGTPNTSQALDPFDLLFSETMAPQLRPQGWTKAQLTENGWKPNTNPKASDVQRYITELATVLMGESNEEDPTVGFAGMVDNLEDFKKRCGNNNAVLPTKPANPDPYEAGITPVVMKQREARRARHLQWVALDKEIIISTRFFHPKQFDAIEINGAPVAGKSGRDYIEHLQQNLQTEIRLGLDWQAETNTVMNAVYEPCPQGMVQIFQDLEAYKRNAPTNSVTDTMIEMMASCALGRSTINKERITLMHTTWATFKAAEAAKRPPVIVDYAAFKKHYLAQTKAAWEETSLTGNQSANSAESVLDDLADQTNDAIQQIQTQTNDSIRDVSSRIDTLTTQFQAYMAAGGNNQSGGNRDRNTNNNSGNRDYNRNGGGGGRGRGGRQIPRGPDNLCRIPWIQYKFCHSSGVNLHCDGTKCDQDRPDGRGKCCTKGPNHDPTATHSNPKGGRINSIHHRFGYWRAPDGTVVARKEDYTGPLPRE